MTEKGLESYFSCNPANINMNRTIETFSSGLGYIKYSIESTDDNQYKSIRGQAANFTESYKNIMRLLEIKAQRNYKTVIVITMLDLNRENQAEEYANLKEKFTGCDVYIYLKSQDQLWYDNTKMQTRSIHWQEFCQFPWSSMTIKSNGECVSCVEDYDNEIVLGDASENTLYSIWNSHRYRNFRKSHYSLTPGIKCTEQCDMKLIGEIK
jgi:radical SAM protein with 4Fe4S-binding SPASM domain